jgi:hypothetical protein
MNRRDFQIQRQAEAIKADPASYAASPFGNMMAEQAGLDLNSLVAEQEAQKAGFSSVADQQANRMMRNQLEEKATRLGVPLADAYALAGSDLTNTQALQNAWNQLTGPTVDPPTDGGGDEPPTEDPVDEGPDYSGLADEIMAGVQGLLSKMPDYGAELAQIRKEMLEGQKTLAANLANSYQTPNLQIQPASSTSSDTAGTQAFRRRSQQFNTGAAGTVLAGLNLGQPSMMNV